MKMQFVFGWIDIQMGKRDWNLRSCYWDSMIHGDSQDSNPFFCVEILLFFNKKTLNGILPTNVLEKISTFFGLLMDMRYV